jgi:hypothetical protein
VIAIDGTKVAANANPDRTMTYWHLEQMNEITGQGIAVLIPSSGPMRVRPCAWWGRRPPRGFPCLARDT